MQTARPVLGRAGVQARTRARSSSAQAPRGTTARRWFLGRDDVSPGSFVAAVGADNPDKQEIDPSLLAASTVVVDVLEQCATIGDLRHALAAGVKLHGCTVHYVRAAMDDGPIIAQGAVPVLAGDTADSLAARVLAVEHRLYPQALALVASGRTRLAGDRLSIDGPARATDAMLISPAP